MLKKFNIHEWILYIKSWSVVVIPHISICLIYILYILIGASVIQEIESEEIEISSSIKPFQQERERLLIKIIEKREIFDLQQYTKYVYKHIRQYEEEIRKQIISEGNSSLNFSKSLVFISTTLTTIGSNEFIPKTKLGKLFLIIYTGFGIPLTLVFLTDLSYLINQFIWFGIYSLKYFLHIRGFSFFYLIEEEKFHLLKTSSTSENNLTIMQLILTIFIYILIGSCFISSESFFESFYLCFTTIFTINLNTNIYHQNNFVFFIIYLFIGLAIVLLCIKDVKKRIEIFLTNIATKLLRNLVQLTEEMGFHDLDTDDSIINTDMNSFPISESVISRQRNLSRTTSFEQQLTLRPIGIAEPLRRLSSGLIRAFKGNENDENKHLDKSVQVCTIIRRCGRCAETSLPIRPVRKLSPISLSSSSMTDNSSSFEDDDDGMNLAPPNFDRIRQRRATLVAKTIISQMATQPRSSSIDELIPLLTLQTNRGHRSDCSPPIPVKNSVNASTPSPPPDSSRKRSNSQVEFLEISKQISGLLTPSDDENEIG